MDLLGATISQNNEIDGDDALGIAGITQVIVDVIPVAKQVQEITMQLVNPRAMIISLIL